MRSIEDVKALFQSASIETHPGADRAVLEDALQAGGLVSTRDADRAGTNIWRRIMRSRLSKLAAAAVIVVAAFIVIQRSGGSIDGAGVAWGDVRDAFLRQHWVHVKYDNGEERWSNLQTGDSYFKNWNGGCVAVDYARNLRQSYEPAFGRHISEDRWARGVMPPWEPKTAWDSVLGHWEQMAEQGRTRDWEVERHLDQTGSTPLIRFDCHLNDAAGRRLLVQQIWADPKTRLPLSIWERLQLAEREKQKREAITGTFDFPQTGPASLYDLGVSRELPIVKNYGKVAAPSVEKVVDAAKAAGERFPARYLALVWDNTRVREIDVVWRDDKRIRKNRYSGFGLSVPATAQEVLNWAQTQTPIETYLFEGTKTYSRRYAHASVQKSEDRARVMRDSSGFMLPVAARPVEEQWFYARVNPATLERIEDAPQELSKYIGLRTNAGDIRREYYIDPEHDYICVRNIWWKRRAGQWEKEREYEYSDFTRLPQGQWYATKRILVIYPDPERNTARGGANWSVHVQLLEEADFPLDTFNGDKLLEGATLETY